MLSEQDTIEILAKFPPVECAFAYGSGAVTQGGYTYTLSSDGGKYLPMLVDPRLTDLVFVINDPVQWHRDNRIRNADHYSTLFPMTDTTIAWIQSLGAGMWYNALVPMGITKFPKRMMKYGVISKTKLLEDLSTWSSVYIAGRLHKPVQYLMKNKEIEAMIEENKRLALMVTLSLLPRVFREVDLYLKLASLSYIGDPRMVIGENPKKVVNLVTPIVSVYRDLYKSTLAEIGLSTNLKLLTEHGQDGLHTVYTQDVSRSTRWSMALQFPLTLRRILFIRGRARISKRLPPSKTAIRTALASIVTKSAVPQSAKGMLTVGIAKVSQYLFAKMMKRFGGLSKIFVSS